MVIMRGRVLAVLGVMLGVVMLGAPAAVADPPSVPPWSSSVRWWDAGGSTGWSKVPVQSLAWAGQDDYDNFVHGDSSWVVSEGYATGSSVEVQIVNTVRTYTERRPPRTFGFHIQVECENLSTGRLSVLPASGSTGSMVTRPTPTGGPGAVSEDTFTITMTCPSGQRPSGVLLEFGIWDQQQVKTLPTRMFFDPAWEHELLGPDIATCRAIFGPDYTEETVAVVDGRSVTAGEYGCGEDYLDDDSRYTDFNFVCAGAPRAEWLSFSWLGPWIGHYADCLFVPRGSWDHEGRIAEVMEGGWFGEVVQLQDGLDGGVAGAGCGTAVSNLPGPMGSISTCPLGAVWPASMRNLAGLAVVGMSSVACIFVLVRFMRVGAS